MQTRTASSLFRHHILSLFLLPTLFLFLGMPLAAQEEPESVFGERVEVGRAGDNVGCLLRKTAHTAVEKGQVVAAAGTITPSQP